MSYGLLDSDGTYVTEEKVEAWKERIAELKQRLKLTDEMLVTAQTQNMDLETDVTFWKNAHKVDTRVADAKITDLERQIASQKANQSAIDAQLVERGKMVVKLTAQLAEAQGRVKTIESAAINVINAARKTTDFIVDRNAAVMLRSLKDSIWSLDKALAAEESK